MCCLAHIYVHCTVQCLLYKLVYRLACMCTCVHCTVLSLLYRLAHMWPAVVGGAGHCLQQESFQQYCSTAQQTVVHKSSNTLQHSPSNCSPVHKSSNTLQHSPSSCSPVHKSSNTLQHSAVNCITQVLKYTAAQLSQL